MRTEKKAKDSAARAIEVVDDAYDTSWQARSGPRPLASANRAITLLH